LYQVGNEVRASGKPFYGHPLYGVFDDTVLRRTFVASTADRQIAWINNAKVSCFNRSAQESYEPYLKSWGKSNIAGLRAEWERDCGESRAVALAGNAVVLATTNQLQALSLADGKPLWTERLPGAPVLWGVTVTREGSIVVTLEDGRVVCFGQKS
jgi:hypothetical protein